MVAVKFPNGKDYAVAPLGLTDEACELLEIQEEMDGEEFSMARFVRCVRNCAVQSMLAAGNTIDEVNEALASVPLSVGGDSRVFKDLLSAMIGGTLAPQPE